MNKITEMIIDKYKLIPMVVMLTAVFYLVVGLSEINWGIFAGNLVLLATVVVFVQETKKVMKSKDAKELLRHESPINWLKACVEFIVFSILSSLAYAFANVQNVGVGYNPIIEYLLIFCVAFFLLGLLYAVRIIWFIIDPASKANITAGKVMKTTIANGIKILLVFSVLFFQIINGLMLHLILNLIFVSHTVLRPFAIVYLFTLVLSFIAIIPCLHQIIFRLNKESRIRDWIAFFLFFSPWILLITYDVLLRTGIVHL